MPAVLWGCVEQTADERLKFIFVYPLFISGIYDTMERGGMELFGFVTASYMELNKEQQ